MSKRSYLLVGLAALMALIGSLLVLPAFAQGPDGCEGVASPGEHEDFGDGWSDHWTDADNTTNNHEPPGTTWPDFDMGLDDPLIPTYYCVNAWEVNHPIDFWVIISSLGVSEPYVTHAWLYACGQGDWGEIDYFTVNGHDVGALSEDPAEPGCHEWYAVIPNDWVNVGDNLFVIGLTDPESEEDCLAVHAGGLYLEQQAPPAPFVPEANTMILLGSGLAGLTGYATLAWRAKRKVR